MRWTDLSTAPATGTVVAESDALTKILALNVNSEAGTFPVLLVRTGGELRGYVNMCPHQFLPLDHRSPRILSHDGAKLMCSMHAALFDARTGEGVAGAGLGCSLIDLPLREEDGWIAIAP